MALMAFSSITYNVLPSLDNVISRIDLNLASAKVPFTKFSVQSELPVT